MNQTAPLRSDQTTARSASGRKRILVLGKYYPPHHGGIEEFVRGMFELAHDHYDVTVLVHNVNATNRVERHGRSVVKHVSTWAVVASQPISPRMAFEILRRQADLIHLHAPNVLATLFVALLRPRTPVVVTHHADIVGFGLAGKVAVALYRRVLKRARMVTVLSLRNRALARDLDGVDVPCVALPVALDEDEFRITDETRALAMAIRARNPANSVTFIFVGRLVPYKGLHVLVEALSYAQRNLHVLIVGDGPQRPEIERQARLLGVSDRIRFMGKVDHETKLSALCAADAFVLPSVTTAEAFGIVQVEAQLCRLPIVATRLASGVTDVTRDGETGLLVEPGDALGLAEAMDRLAADPALRRRLGEAGCARARANYTKAAVRRSLEAIYETALGDAA